MTWQPIGPEQMDGRVIAAGWELFPSELAFVKKTPSGWFDVAKGRISSAPTHYWPGVRPLGEPDAAPSGKTVRVRVAAAVDPTGQWSANGWSGADGDDMDLAIDGVGEGEARYWITADLPIPVVREIVASVEDA